MGFLDRFRKKRKRQQAPRVVTPPRYPSRTLIDEPDLRTVDDLARRYPLPAGFTYRQREQSDFVVVREKDQAVFVFLIEEGILSFDEPYSKPDGRTGYKTTEVLRAHGA